MNSSENFQNFFNVFADILRAVHSSTRLQGVLDVVVTKSAAALNAKGALLRILNSDTGLFEIRAACGLGEIYLSKGSVSRDVLISAPYELHKVHIITDIWHAPRVEHPQEIWDEGIRMLLDVPFATIEDKMVGLLRVYLSEKREFSEVELDFIMMVAEQCACIIERVQLLENKQAQFNHLAAQVDKLASLGRMAAGIAHEINNPLAGVLLYSTNMLKKVPPNGPIEEGLRIIIKETQRCKTIIQGLLDFSREQESEKVPADINEIIETALRIVENEFHIRQVQIRKQLAAGMEKTLLDKNQVEQVLINLLLNALQAIDKNGLVSVKSVLDSNGTRILVEIADNGCGIAPGDLKNIFEPFYSTKSNGTGLGLSVSYGIVKNHQGNIRVFSEPGKGSRFVIEFPVLVG